MSTVLINSSGSGATGTAAVAGGIVTGIAVGSGGAGYIKPPIVVLTGGFVLTITLTKGGMGYVSVPAVTFDSDSGSGSTATATVSDGIVTAITITNRGTGYTSAPTISIVGGSGTGATATATVSIIATATAVLTDGAVTSFLITNGGTGYLVAPTVSIRPAGSVVIDTTTGKRIVGISCVCDNLSVLIANLFPENLMDCGSYPQSVMPYVTASASISVTLDPTQTYFLSSSTGLSSTTALEGIQCDDVCILTPATALDSLGFATGSGAAATVTVTGTAITAVTLTHGGTGYQFPPLLSFVGAVGSGGAVANCTVSGGAVTTITLVQGGSGYPSGTTVNFTPVGNVIVSDIGCGSRPGEVCADSVAFPPESGGFVSEPTDVGFETLGCAMPCVDVTDYIVDGINTLQWIQFVLVDHGTGLRSSPPQGTTAISLWKHPNNAIGAPGTPNGTRFNVAALCGCCGTCCLPNGTCAIMTEAACAAAGGNYTGVQNCTDADACDDFSPCCIGYDGTPPTPTDYRGTCLMTSEAGCASNNGTWHPEASDCCHVTCAACGCQQIVNSTLQVQVEVFLSTCCPSGCFTFPLSNGSPSGQYVEAGLASATGLLILTLDPTNGCSSPLTLLTHLNFTSFNDTACTESNGLQTVNINILVAVSGTLISWDILLDNTVYYSGVANTALCQACAGSASTSGTGIVGSNGADQCGTQDAPPKSSGCYGGGGGISFANLFGVNEVDFVFISG